MGDHVVAVSGVNSDPLNSIWALSRKFVRLGDYILPAIFSHLHYDKWITSMYDNFIVLARRRLDYQIVAELFKPDLSFGR